MISIKLESQAPKNDVLRTPIEYLKGVGPARAELLKSELGIRVFKDLLEHFPFRYIDRTKYHQIAELHPDQPEVQIIGRLVAVQEDGPPRKKRLTAKLQDASGVLTLVWFRGVRWIKDSLPLNEEVVVFGRPIKYGAQLQIAHPEIERMTQHKQGVRSHLSPVYPSTEKLTKKGLNGKAIAKLTANLLTTLHGVGLERIPERIRSSYALIGAAEAYRCIHFPTSDRELKEALRRLKFEEFLLLQLEMLSLKQHRQKKFRSHPFPTVGDHFNTFYKAHLPFELTGAQKRVIKEIRSDLARPAQMNRLLQGDVGSGKTMVALLVMLIAADNGFQSCLMAPTEILATQHFNGLKELLDGMNINIALLTGSTPKKDRAVLQEALENGSLHILVGTHAILEDKVSFHQLGLAIIDEQHRFGVAQRAKLWKKNTLPPHVLVMTATPIPRTLAMSFYGDLDVSVIDELPPGRQPIITSHRFESARLGVFSFLRGEISKGSQVYIVYPLIEESQKLDYKNLMEGYEVIIREFPRPDYQVSVVHGQMPAAEKQLEMERFAKGETHIMVATTVIEVGVNVPNATVMVIESAERFGLSQLHQLRGRVGRGGEQSYCILMTGPKSSADAKVRMNTMVESQDGFVLSEVDLKLRGPGDLMGTQQSGIVDLKVGNLSTDGTIIKAARMLAAQILENDPQLLAPEWSLMRERIVERTRDKMNWSRIA